MPNKIKITLAIIGEKMDNMHHDIKEIKGDVRTNTEFRLQIKGFVAALVVLGGFVGSFITWIISKVGPK